MIFVLDADIESPIAATSLSLYLPSNLQGKLQLPIRVGSLGPKVEQFCLDRNLMPSGFLLNVTELAIQLWNFDDLQDKKRLRCRLESMVTFAGQEAIACSAFNEKQNLLIVLHTNMSVSAFQLGKL